MFLSLGAQPCWFVWQCLGCILIELFINTNPFHSQNWLHLDHKVCDHFSQRITLRGESLIARRFSQEACFIGRKQYSNFKYYSLNSCTILVKGNRQSQSLPSRNECEELRMESTKLDLFQGQDYLHFCVLVPWI